MVNNNSSGQDLLLLPEIPGQARDDCVKKHRHAGFSARNVSL